MSAAIVQDSDGKWTLVLSSGEIIDQSYGTWYLRCLAWDLKVEDSNIFFLGELS